MGQLRNIVRLTLVVLAACSVLPCGAAAASVGTSGYSFLKIVNGARQASLGGAFTGLANDASSLGFNPAGMVSLPAPSVMASYHNYVIDLQSGMVSYVAPQTDGSSAIGVSLTYLDYGTFTQTNLNGDILGEFGGSDLMLTAGYARKLSDRISAGVSAKFISERVQDYSSAAIAADIGFRYAADRDRYTVGLTLQHLGTELSSLGNEKVDLPFTARLGGAYRLRGVKMILLGDIVMPRDNDPYLAVGAEYIEIQSLAFRAGWSSFGSNYRTEDSNDKVAGLGFGVGFRPTNQLDIGYAFNPAAELGQSHRVSVSWLLESPE